MKIIAAVVSPYLIKKILSHLKLPHEPPKILSLPRAPEYHRRFPPSFIEAEKVDAINNDRSRERSSHKKPKAKLKSEVIHEVNQRDQASRQAKALPMALLVGKSAGCIFIILSLSQRVVQIRPKI